MTLNQIIQEIEYSITASDEVDPQTDIIDAMHELDTIANGSAIPVIAEQHDCELYV